MLSSDRDTIGSALGRIPSGAGVLTAAHDGRATGMLVSWFQQTAFDPPMLSIALRHGRPIAALIDGSGAFVLHVAAADEAAALFRHFGKGFSLDEDAFVGLAFAPTAFGPLLSTAPIALGCHVRSRVTAGDHDLYLAEILAARGDTARAPYVHIRKSGLSY